MELSDWERTQIIKRSVANFFGALNGKCVLDIGSRNGYHLSLYEPKMKVALDIDLPTLKINKEKNRILADARHLPIRNKLFDVVLFSEVIEHIPNVGKALKEIDRVVTEKLLITTDNNCLLRRLHLFLHGKKSPLGGHYREYSWREVIDMIEMYGFELSKFSGYGFVFKKPRFLTEKLKGKFPKLSSHVMMEFTKSEMVKN